jgi:large subunit ribosomal protein L22
MGKPKNPRRLAETEAQAIGRNIRTSPYKLNLVAEMIRGKKVDKALAALAFSRKRIASEVKKVLQSAVANAENNHDLDVDELYVKEAYVGKNLVLKRFHARGRGRGAGIQKFFAQLTVVVREGEPETKKSAPRRNLSPERAKEQA